MYPSSEIAVNIFTDSAKLTTFTIHSRYQKSIFVSAYFQLWPKLWSGFGVNLNCYYSCSARKRVYGELEHSELTLIN